MSTKTITDGAFERERIAGAKACLALLRNLEKTVHPDPYSTVQDVWDAKRKEAITAFVEAAGPLSPRAVGVLSLLAEFVVSEEQDGSTYFKEVWRPNVTLANTRRDDRTHASHC